MSDIDQVIYKLFSERWSGDLSTGGIEDMRNQLHKNLTNQVNGYWSGHTAYHIMVDGGFLVDSKSGVPKKLTQLGQVFMNSMGGMRHNRTSRNMVGEEYVKLV